jgi:hypothetical protein
MKKSFSVAVLAIMFVSPFAKADTLPCDKKVIEKYVTDSKEQYDQLVVQGKLSPAERQFFSQQVDEIKTNMYIYCKWEKPVVVPFCDEQKADFARWDDMKAKGLIDEDEYHSLVESSLDLGLMRGIACK